MPGLDLIGRVACLAPEATAVALAVAVRVILSDHGLRHTHPKGAPGS